MERNTIYVIDGISQEQVQPLLNKQKWFSPTVQLAQALTREQVNTVGGDKMHRRDNQAGLTGLKKEKDMTVIKGGIKRHRTLAQSPSSQRSRRHKYGIHVPKANGARSKAKPKKLTVYIRPESIVTLKHLAVDNGSSVSALVQGAIDEAYSKK